MKEKNVKARKVVSADLPEPEEKREKNEQQRSNM